MEGVTSACKFQGECPALPRVAGLACLKGEVERRVAESLRELDPRRTRAIIVAILRDVTIAHLVAQGFGEEQIIDLSASGASVLIRAVLPGRDGQPGRTDDVKLNIQALEKIERSLRLIGVAPEGFDWIPRNASASITLSRP